MYGPFLHMTNVLYDGQTTHKAYKLPKLKVNDGWVIDMLMDYLIGDLVFVANENNIIQC